MKKIILTLIVLMFAFTPAMAEVAFDGVTPNTLSADPDDATATSGSVEICKPSNNVYGNVLSSANRFAATTLHNNGTFQYATSSEDTKIYRLGRTDTYVGTAQFDQGLSTSDTTDFSGWKAL